MTRLPIITASRRRWWDVVVFLVIILSAFEVPYSTLIGWEETNTTLAFEWLYFFVFGIDIAINLCTPRAGTPKESIGQPEVARDYIRSRWFIIDLVAWAPFYLVFHFAMATPMVRTLRLVGAARMLRALKGLRALQELNNLFFRHPALGRFIALALVVPWLVHLHAVVLVFAESRAPGGQVQGYADALHWVYIGLVTQDPPPVSTVLGYCTWISNTILALLVVSTVIGNTASLMFSMDDARREMERRLTQWNRLFRQQPEVFEPDLQDEIVVFEHHRAHQKKSFAYADEKIFADLPADLERRVRAALGKTSENSGE